MEIEGVYGYIVGIPLVTAWVGAANPRLGGGFFEEKGRGKKRRNRQENHLTLSLGKPEGDGGGKNPAPKADNNS